MTTTPEGRLAIGGLLGVFALACCQTASPSGPATPTEATPPPSSGAPTIAAVSATPTATPTTSTAPSSTAPTTPPAPAAREPDALLPGHFTCGAFSQCRNGETCCPYAELCVPRGQEPDDCGPRSECDTSSDCASGKSCCDNVAMLSAPYYERRCQAQACREAEACRKGTCPRGQRCHGLDPDKPRSLGRCGNAKSRIECGGVVCAGDEPWCGWDPDTDEGSCHAPISTNSWAYQCDDDTDCLQGERCWLGAVGSYCCRGDACFDHAAPSRYVACERVRDCPSLQGMTFTCEPDESLPPWAAKRCFPHYP